MTDPSHALGQRPFEQCELLYQAAELPEERAYALGCFLHGSTDGRARRRSTRCCSRPRSERVP